MSDLKASAYGVMCALVLEDGRRWGDTAAQFQRDNALDILDIGAEVRQSWIELPRGARKTTDLAGLLLALLVTQAPAGARLYVGASDQDQAAEIVDAAAGLISRTLELEGQFQVTGLVITLRSSGASLTALPADASAMGKRAWLIVLDEVANWPDTRRAVKFWDVLTSGGRKIADCRTVVITNAGSPSHWAWKRREVARLSSWWRFCSIPGPLPWLSPVDLEVLRENATTPTEFERLHLNVWAEPEDQLASREDVEAAVVAGRKGLDPLPGVRYVIGADLSQVKDYTAVVTLHVREDGGRRLVILDQLRVWKPSRGSRVPLEDVRLYIAAESARFHAAQVVMDAHQARLMIEQLKAAGVQAVGVDFTVAGNNTRAGLLLGLLREGRVELLDDEELVDELAALRLQETNTPGIYKLASTSRDGHFDRTTALALAAEHALQGRRRVLFVDPFAREKAIRPAPGDAPGGPRPDGSFTVGFEPVDVRGLQGRRL